MCCLVTLTVCVFFPFNVTFLTCDQMLTLLMRQDCVFVKLYLFVGVESKLKTDFQPG